jgi:hypothetical protein
MPPIRARSKFRAEAVWLIRAGGKTIPEVSKDLGVSEQSSMPRSPGRLGAGGLVEQSSEQLPRPPRAIIDVTPLTACGAGV